LSRSAASPAPPRTWPLLSQSDTASSPKTSSTRACASSPRTGALGRRSSSGSPHRAAHPSGSARSAGSVDPLREIAEITPESGAWLHVDAAYGGALLFSKQGRGMIAGIESADSITVDFHKLFWQPIPCSTFLLRDAHHFEAIKLHADYLNPESHEEEGIPNLVTTSLLTSRRFDALKLWISFQALGRGKLGAMIDRTVSLASHAANVIRRTPQFELVCEPQLGTVVFRYVPNAGRNADAFNFALKQTLFNEGIAVVGHTRVRGAQCLKFTCMNPATSEGEIEALIQTIVARGKRLEAA